MQVVVPLCGGNIDTTVLGRVIDRGLAADQRLIRFSATVSDRPGGIATFSRDMADVGVSIKVSAVTCLPCHVNLFQCRGHDSALNDVHSPSPPLLI